MAEGVAAQEALRLIAEEVLATTKLPMAIDYLVGELKLVGTLSTAMARISHYFTPFQTFVISAAEEEEGRFDMRIALDILEKEAAYRGEDATPEGLFFYRFECLSRNRLDYSKGLTSIAADSVFDDAWREWITTVSRQVGFIDLADLVYIRSEEYWRLESRAAAAVGREPPLPDRPILFGSREGRIARANRGKDPLFFFLPCSDSSAIQLSPGRRGPLLPKRHRHCWPVGLSGSRCGSSCWKKSPEAGSIWRSSIRRTYRSPSMGRETSHGNPPS